MQSVATDFWSAGGLPLEILLVVTCMVALMCLSSMVDSFQPLLASIFKWKEADLAGNSMKLRIARRRTSLGLVLPFVLVASRYGLLTCGDEPLGTILITGTVFSAYLLLRLVIRLFAGIRGKASRGWYGAVSCHYGYFAILTAVMLVSAAILTPAGVSDTVVREVLLWEIGGLYLLNLVRKLQILVHYNGFFGGILYLCTLEILPSGTLLAVYFLIWR